MRGFLHPCLYISLSWDLMCHTSSAYIPLVEIRMPIYHCGTTPGNLLSFIHRVLCYRWYLHLLWHKCFLRFLQAVLYKITKQGMATCMCGQGWVGSVAEEDMKGGTRNAGTVGCNPIRSSRVVSWVVSVLAIIIAWPPTGYIPKLIIGMQPV